jgi:AcrR family transcriptional regulator
LQSEIAEFSQRERSKSARRERIIEATYQCLREEGLANVSIKAIAARAGISAPTIYNLFGSKGGVLGELSARRLREYQRRIDEVEANDALDRVFVAAGLAARIYGTDPVYYREIGWVMLGGLPEENDIYSKLHTPRVEFWIHMLERARDDGFIKAEADLGALARMITQVAYGAMVDWIFRGTAAEKMGQETEFGCASALLAFATDKAVDRVRAVLDKPQPALNLDKAE